MMRRDARLAEHAPPHDEDRASRRGTAPERIHLYVKHFPPSGTPLRVGTNKAVHGLAAGLVHEGIATSVWCEGEIESQVQTPQGYDIRCFATRADYRTFRLAATLRAHLRTLDPTRDLVVLNGMFHPSVYALSRKLRSLGIAYVVAPHGPYHPWAFRKNPHLKWPYWYLLERPVLKHALALQQLDVRHEMFARRLGIQTPIITTENGFLNSDVAPLKDLRWRTQGTPRVLYWGRFAVHTKGLDVLLAGFERAALDHPMVLTMQGPDWAGELPAVKRMADALSVADDIEMLPPVFDIPAPRAMAAHDIVCMPSRFEGFGLSALEAMLAARVLLVSRTAGIAPHVERSRCGVIVEPTAEDIRRGFDELLAKRGHWREMGLRGRDYALDNLHWNAIAQRTLTQYRRLMN